jgi:cytochrome c2
MKKFLKVLLYIVVGLVTIVVIGAAIISFRGIPKYKAEKITVHIDYTPERVEQGAKLASMLCKSCHYNEDTKHFSGRQMKEVTQFGSIFSKNITNDKDAGIANWTDGELIYFIRTGVKPDGTYVPPYMPKLAHISDEDMFSIISFLRSNHDWVQPDKTKQPECEPSFLAKFLTNIKAFEPFPYPTKPIAGPDTTDPVKHGEYIALYQLECFACHSKDFSKNDYFNPHKSEGFFGGGNKMLDLTGNEIYTLNITQDETNGIGKWSEDEFIKAVKFGIVPGNQPGLRYPMIPYSNLTDKEAKAIYAYLKTVPKQPNKVERILSKQE